MLEEAVQSDPNFNLNLTVLFSNIRTLQDFHIDFLTDIKQADILRNVADCFLQRKQQFIYEYTIYCNNYPNACEILKAINFNQDLKSLSNFRICQQSLGHMLPLAAYLLKPVQRILKYPLLIKAMLKEAFTINYNHFAVNGYQEMKTALDCMSEVADEINLMKRKHEITLRVNEIQSMLVGWQGQDLNCFGELLRHEQLKIKGYRRERQVFLFEKLLLVAKLEDEQYTQPMHILVSNLMLLETLKEGNNYLRIYEQKNPQKYFLIEFSSVNLRKEWANAVKNLILLSGPAMPENHRKRILEACQSTDQDVLCHTEHTPHNKFRDLANIKKRFRYRVKSKRHSTNHPPTALLVDLDDSPRMRHSATFSQSMINPRDSNRVKRLSDATNYDSQFIENEIRSNEEFEASNISITSPSDSSYPTPIDEHDTSQPDQPYEDLISTPEENSQDTSIPTSVSNSSMTSSSKSPSRTGAIRRKTNTYLTKKLSASLFDSSLDDEFGMRNPQAKLRRRHTDDEIHPDILDALNQLNDFNALECRGNTTAKSEDSDSDNSKQGPDSPEYFKQRVPVDNSERKRSRIMDSDEAISQYDLSLDFASPDASFTSLANQSMPSPKYKSSANRNKMSRRIQVSRSGSTAKKRLFFGEDQFNPDPSSLATTPQQQLKDYFAKEIGKLSFTSNQSYDDNFIRNRAPLIDAASKFNTIRPKKSSLKSLFEEIEDPRAFRRHFSVPHPYILTNLFDSPVKSTDEIENSTFESSVESSTKELKENFPENEPIIEKSPETIETSETNEIQKTRVLLDGPPSDSSDSDSINNEKNMISPESCTQSSTLEDYVTNLQSEDFGEILKHQDFVDTLRPESILHEEYTATDVENESVETICDDTMDSKPLLRHSNQTQPLPGRDQSESQVKPRNYATQVLQFSFVGFVGVILAINIIYEVFYSRR